MTHHCLCSLDLDYPLVQDSLFQEATETLQHNGNILVWFEPLEQYQCPQQADQVSSRGGLSKYVYYGASYVSNKYVPLQKIPSGLKSSSKPPMARMYNTEPGLSHKLQPKETEIISVFTLLALVDVL